MENKKGYDYLDYIKQATGNDSEEEDYKIIIYKFDKYEVLVQLNSRNQFMGITEIRLNKEFITFKQKTDISSFFDMEKYYQDEE